jgi:hypothetical protein
MSDSVYFDIYVLAKERSRRIYDILACDWVGTCIPLQDTYDIVDETTGESGPDLTLEEYLQQMLSNPTLSGVIYWQYGSQADKEKNVPRPQLFFNSDGGMIVGCAVTEMEDTEFASLLLRLAQRFDSDYGYIVCENPPELSTREFIQVCEYSDLTIFHGQLRMCK